VSAKQATGNQPVVDIQ